MIEWIVSSSVLIAVVTALRFLLRGKISAKLQYALWALVLIRLLMPYGIFETGFSVENIVTGIRSQPALQNAISNIQKPEISYEEACEQAEAELLAKEEQDTAFPESGTNMLTGEKVAQRAVEIVNYSTPAFVLEAVLQGIWYAGIAVIAICFLLSNIKFARKLKRNRTLLCDGRIPVYTCANLETPCLFGLVKPAIYLAPEEAADEVRCRHILAHEHTHFRHLDHIWSILRCVCLALHWYNPLVWVAAILSRRDSELACDEATIQRLGEEERIPYGETLVITTCATKPTTSLLGIATTMTGSIAAIKERVMMIAKKIKMNIYALIAVVLVVAVAVGCTYTGGSDGNEIVTVYCVTKVSSKSATTNNNRSTTHTYSYDEHGNLIKIHDSDITYFTYDKNGHRFEGKGECTFDENGNLVTMRTSGGSRYEYTYDSQGNMLSEIVYSPSGDAREYQFMTYDSAGRILTRETDEYNGYAYTYNWEYDHNGNLVHYQAFREGVMCDELTCTYFDNGLLKSREKMVYGSRDYVDLLYRLEYSYDHSGRITGIVSHEDWSIDAALGQPHEIETIRNEITLKYDIYGNVIEQTSSYEDGNSSSQHWTYDHNNKPLSLKYDDILLYEWAYDSNGNLLTATVYYQGEISSITTYTYTSFQVTKAEARRIQAQQKAFVDYIDYYPWEIPFPDPLLE